MQVYGPTTPEVETEWKGQYKGYIDDLWIMSTWLLQKA